MSKKSRAAMKVDLNNPALERAAKIIGNAVGEDKPQVLFQLKVMRGLTDDKFMAKILSQVLAIKKGEQDWLMTDDGKHKRSLGGCFFKLAKDSMSPKVRWNYMRITRPKTKKKRQLEQAKES